MRFSSPRGTVRATFTAHGSGRVIQIGRLLLRALRQVGSVHVLLHTPNLHLPSHDFLPFRGPPSGFRRHPFGSGIALWSRLWIPVAFRLLAFAAETIPSPLRICTAVAVGLLACTRPYRGYHVPLLQDAPDVGALFSPVDIRCSRALLLLACEITMHRSTIHKTTLVSSRLLTSSHSDG